MFIFLFCNYFQLVHSFYIVPSLVSSWQLTNESSVKIHLFHSVFMMYNKSKYIWYENRTSNIHIFASVVYRTPNMLLRYKVVEGVISQPCFRIVSLVIPKEIVE